MEQDSQSKSLRWTMSATPRVAILRGVIEAPSTPAFVLMATFIEARLIGRLGWVLSRPPEERIRKTEKDLEKVPRGE